MFDFFLTLGSGQGGFLESLKKLWDSTGLVTLSEGKNWLKILMMCVAGFMMFLAISKKFEPNLLLAMSFGMFIINIPGAYEILYHAANPVAPSDYGLIYYLYKGVDLVIYPPLIFLGIGAMTDFGPLIANPKSLLLGAAAQIGIFVTFIIAFFLFTYVPFDTIFGQPLGVDPGKLAASVAIIGGADGPTAIYLTAKLANNYMGSIAIAAYSYMALVPVIQPPIMKALTTKKERSIVMEQLRPVSKREKILFPIIVTGICGIILPTALPLLAMLMLGNLMKESEIVPRLTETAKNELINIITILLGLVVGTKAYADVFLTGPTLIILVLGVFAFSVATASGVLIGKIMCKLSGGKINPLIGAAGVSAVPMAARVAQDVGKKDNPNNYLLMHAMGPNVAGVIGSAVAAGALLAIFL